MAIKEEMHSLAQEIVQSYEDRANGIAQLRLDVGAMLRGFDAAHATMSRKLKAHLAKGRSDLATMSRELKADLGKVAQRRISDVSAMLQGFQARLQGLHDEQAGAREEWGKLAATMQAKRRGLRAGATPQRAGQDKSVFDYLANHPNGTRMTKLEQEFGMPRVQMAKALKGLMDESKAKKRDLLYFAT